jgi:coproporphyrinogen III oxidase-like Fe-S oxidoreductase
MPSAISSGSASAIGAIGPTYSQNARTLDEYYSALDRNQVPIARGVELNRDDLVRRSVIHALMCHFAVSKTAVGAGYLIEFDGYSHPSSRSCACLSAPDCSSWAGNGSR